LYKFHDSSYKFWNTLPHCIQIIDQGQLKVSLTFINIKYDSSLEQTIPLFSKLNLRYLIFNYANKTTIQWSLYRDCQDHLQVVQPNFAIRVSFLQVCKNGMFCLYLFSYFYILQAMSSRRRFLFCLETRDEMTSVTV